MPIEAFVFDLGGVIFADGSRVLEESFSGEDRARVRAVVHSSEAKRLRRGLMTDEDFWRWAAPRLPARLDADGFRRAWYDCYELDRDIWRLIERLHGSYLLGIFSGNIRSRVEYLDRKYDFRRWFDVETYSYDHRMSKPDPAFVEAMLADVGRPPSRIVYLDDRESCLAPAVRRGVHGVLYARGEIRPVRERLGALGVALPASVVARSDD